MISQFSCDFKKVKNRKRNGKENGKKIRVYSVFYKYFTNFLHRKDGGGKQRGI